MSFWYDIAIIEAFHPEEKPFVKDHIYLVIDELIYSEPSHNSIFTLNKNIKIGEQSRIEIHFEAAYESRAEQIKNDLNKLLLHIDEEIKPYEINYRMS